jgi:hypothetical protein
MNASHRGASELVHRDSFKVVKRSAGRRSHRSLRRSRRANAWKGISMFKKLAAVLIAASVIGAPMVASAQSAPSSESRTTVKVAKPHKAMIVKKHRIANRHHVKRVKVVTAHRHSRHDTVVKHRNHVKHVKHVRHVDGSKKKVVIKNTTRAN